MKKNLLFIPLLGALLLVGCGNNDDTSDVNGKYTLTYGTYEHNESLTINYATLSQKMSEKENMIVVTYDDDESQCGCWLGFKYAINELMQKDHYLIYKIKYAQLADRDDDFNLAYASNVPGINFVKDGKVIDKKLYSVDDTDPLFKSTKFLKQTIEEKCNKPNYYYLDYVSLDEKIANKEKMIVSYYWPSCGDCSYAFPSCLIPFGKDKTFTTKAYMVNLEVEGLLLKDGQKVKGNENYVNYLATHNISDANNKQLGYGRGFVPTFQYYDETGLKDAAVCFNDTVSKNENNELVVTQSFYSNERQQYLHYLDGVETKVIEGIKVNLDDVNEYNGKYYWKQDKAKAYHFPLLEAFYKTYAL